MSAYCCVKLDLFINRDFIVSNGSIVSHYYLSERRSRSASCTCELCECCLYRQLARDAPVTCAKRILHVSRVVVTPVIYLTIYL